MFLLSPKGAKDTGSKRKGMQLGAPSMRKGLELEKKDQCGWRAGGGEIWPMGRQRPPLLVRILSCASECVCVGGRGSWGLLSRE